MPSQLITLITSLQEKQQQQQKEDFFNSCLWPIMFCLTLVMYRIASIIPTETRRNLMNTQKFFKPLNLFNDKLIHSLIPK